jgi:hypothetical protein
MSNPEARLDASESIFFKRQLESIDQRLYETVYPENQARSLIPTIPGVEDLPIYTWRMIKQFGKATIVGDMADDVLRSDVSGDEQSQTIKTLASSYAWDIDEIKYAARVGTPLDALKAMSARRAVDTGMDEILALGTLDGVAVPGLLGLLNQSNTSDFTPVTKSGGGLTWANATGDEMAADVFGLVAGIMGAMKMSGGPVFQSFRVVLPIEQYLLAAQKRMGDGSDTTVLSFIKQNSPFVESIHGWHRCNNAAGASTDRMCAFPPSSEVLGAVVPLEFMTLPPQQVNFCYKVLARAKTGGVIARYPVAMGYADGI